MYHCAFRQNDSLTCMKFIVPKISNWFLSRPRNLKRLITLAVDFIAIVIALWLAFSLRYGVIYIPPQEQLWIFLLAPIIAIPIFIRAGLYRAIVRYLGMQALWTIIKATSLYALLFAVVVLLAGVEHVPRTVYGINAIILVLFVGGSRMMARWWFAGTIADNMSSKMTRRRAPPVIIYGAGQSGAQIAAALKVSNQLNPIAFIDDEPTLHRQQINGLNVYPFSELSHVIETFYAQDILLAMPSIARSQRHKIIQRLEPYPIHVRTLPDLVDLAEGKVTIADIREVDIADLLGRESVDPQDDLLYANIKNKTVMVTGAGGSIGGELCRQIIKMSPIQLILYELSEYALYSIEKELKALNVDIPIVSVLGTVLNQSRLELVCQQFNVTTIYHAAAYKHVPMVEKNTTEGIRNNVFGTLSCAKAAIASNVETFVLISTDKAVRPTNTMGASKRFAELVLQGLAKENVPTRFTMVRFGNVLGSSGSVVPLFREQIANGGPVTVTDPRIIRYFMTIPEAAELVIQAGAMGEGGDVFVLDMGEPIRILDLAKRMIHLSGFTEKDDTQPEGDIEITYTGLRPGEKLYEELLIGDNVSDTKHQRILRAQEKVIPWDELTDILTKLEQANNQNDYQQARAILMEHVDGFHPQCEIEDWLRV